MTKFKYKIEEYNTDYYILHITKQCNSLTCLDFEPSKKLYETKNGWEIKSHMFLEIRCSEKIIYIFGRNKENDIFNIENRTFHKNFLKEVREALDEFSNHVNKNFLKIPDKFYEI